MAAEQASFLLAGKRIEIGSLGVYDLRDPATEERIASVPRGGRAEAEHAAQLSAIGFRAWSAVTPIERGKVLRATATQMRAEADEAALEMTREQGKPVAQARAEWFGAADVFDWFAEEARRAYGRIIPSRAADMDWSVRKRPVGPVAAFTPWNFPAFTVAQKLAPALAAGCSVVLKPAEETPSAAWRICRALLGSGLPPEAVGLIWGEPAEISAALIAAPGIAKITLTGSTRVGRLLAGAAGERLKKMTMELGGHNPVIVAGDADLAHAVLSTAQWKFRNAGQVCISPTRFLVDRSLYPDFVKGVALAAREIIVGRGTEPETQMGPLATGGQRDKVEQLVEDAVQNGANLAAGGTRLGNRGYFFAPTVLADVTPDMRVMNEEPFGPLALIAPFDDLDEALAEANRLPFGLAAYAFTNSRDTERKIARSIEAGMLGINHFGLAMPETPFGGVHDSGIGSEGGIEGMDAYMTPFLISSRSPG